MDIYDKKGYFVRTSLKSLLFDADKDILDVYYQHDNATDEEVVTILYLNEDKQKVCVTGDNLLTIAKDVLKHI